jgi:hypothetical protein
MFSSKIRTRTLAAVIVILATLIIVVPLPAHRNYEDSPAAVSVIRDQCTFSNGSTISFGRKILNRWESDDNNVWQTGVYQATMLYVSDLTDVGVKLRAGTYTMFVQNQPEDRPDLWTLIISRKTEGWGMDYPGVQYDVGRTRMGSDMLPTPPAVKNFTIGCLQNKNAPIFMWMQWGTRVAYTKVQVRAEINGKHEWLVH